jgi:3-hydroxybutyrate dehydrogenase
MLSGKAAIVTGSTSGIGLGIARALAQQGANVLLNGFGDQTEIDALLVQVSTEYKVDVAYSAADMSRPEQVNEMIARCVERFDGVDI